MIVGGILSFFGAILALRTGQTEFGSILRSTTRAENPFRFYSNVFMLFFASAGLIFFGGATLTGYVWH